MTDTKLRILAIIAVIWFCLRLIFMRVRRAQGEADEHGGI